MSSSVITGFTTHSGVDVFGAGDSTRRGDVFGSGEVSSDRFFGTAVGRHSEIGRENFASTQYDWVSPGRRTWRRSEDISWSIRLTGSMSRSPCEITSSSCLSVRHPITDSPAMQRSGSAAQLAAGATSAANTTTDGSRKGPKVLLNLVMEDCDSETPPSPCDFLYAIQGNLQRIPFPLD